MRVSDISNALLSIGSSRMNKLKSGNYHSKDQQQEEQPEKWFQMWRLRLSCILSVDMSYARILLGSTSHSDMFQKGLAQAPNCTRGKDRETVDQFLLQCEFQNKQIDQMKKNIAEMWFEQKSSGSLNLFSKVKCKKGREGWESTVSVPPWGKKEYNDDFTPILL